MIDVQHLCFRYKGQRGLVFDDFSLRLEENRIYGLLGRNGTGKSTLLYLLGGLLRPVKGTVSITVPSVLGTGAAASAAASEPDSGGRVAASTRLPALLQDIFLVAETFDLPPISLREYVRLNRPFYPRFSEEVLEQCLHDFELTGDIHLNALSMGQQKKAYMSFALATQTRYLLMDEPTNGLDIPSKSQFRRVIAQHMSDDRTVIISTHQVHDVEQLLDHILILDQRSLLLDASVADLSEQYTFEYRAPQDMADDVLYAEPTLQGNAVIARREGAAETPLNLELLFNYMTNGAPKRQDTKHDETV